MKRRTIKFHLDLDVVFPEHLDDQWVCDQYLSSARFSIDSFQGEPGVIMCASSGVTDLLGG